MVSRNRDIATILGRSEAANASNTALGTGSGGGGADGLQVTRLDSAEVAALTLDSADGGKLIYDTTNEEMKAWTADSFKRVVKRQSASGAGGTKTTMTANGILYNVHTFTSSDTFQVTGSGTLEVEYIIVAGGGAGGSENAYSNNYGGSGGGGAGGYRSSVSGETSGASSAIESKSILSVGSYNVVVGAGGAAVSGNASGSDGGNSSFNSITSIGGGGGGGVNAVGRSGGSGGGGGGAGTSNTTPGQGGSGTSGQGTAGNVGEFVNGVVGYGGHGGGAGSSNFDKAGISSSITGSLVEYAIGGDRAAGSQNANGTNAAVNTGNGGQGGSKNSGTSTSGSGGSGIVIIRYVA